MDVRKAVTKESIPYWEYILFKLYTDDILFVLHKPVYVLAEDRYFTLKESSIGLPNYIWGNHVQIWST